MINSDIFLYAEDDVSYAELMQRALADTGTGHRLIHVPDGEQVVKYLKGEGRYADRQPYPLPALILLDLKMPRFNGFETLKWIRSCSTVRHLPVVVVTSSEELRDVNEAYALGANSFLVKPASATDLNELVRMVDNYWMKLNISPSAK